MKRLLYFGVIMLMIIPALLWIYNASHHRLGMAALEENRVHVSFRKTMAENSYPFLYGNHLFLVSNRDGYIYEYALEPDIKEIDRYLIGGYGKKIIAYEDKLVIGYQELRINQVLLDVIDFEFSSKEITDRLSGLTGRKGAHHFIIYDGWIYTWDLIDDGLTVYALTENDVRSYPVLDRRNDIKSVGFLREHRIENLPVIQVEIDNHEILFLLTPDGPSQIASAKDALTKLGLAEEKIANLIEDGRYLNSYLTQDEIRMARRPEGYKIISSSEEESVLQPFWNDIYSLDDLTMTSRIETISYVYPDNLAVTQDFITPAFYQALEAQIKVIERLNLILKQTEDDITRYLKHDQFRDFITTPTSIGLIIFQIICLYLGCHALKGSDFS